MSNLILPHSIALINKDLQHKSIVSLDDTFGPGFPVGPLAPLEPRGPCIREEKAYPVQSKRKNKCEKLISK